MRGIFNGILAGFLMVGLLVGGAKLAGAGSSQKSCDNATFHVYGIEAENNDVDSVVVLKYDLLASDTARCVTPEKYPLIIPRKQLFCEREIKGVCGMSSPLFKGWSYDAFRN